MTKKCREEDFKNIFPSTGQIVLRVIHSNFKVAITYLINVIVHRTDRIEFEQIFISVQTKSCIGNVDFISIG